LNSILNTVEIKSKLVGNFKVNWENMDNEETKNWEKNIHGKFDELWTIDQS